MAKDRTAGSAVALILKRAFVRLGILPFLLLAALLIFTLMSENFLTLRNLTNVLRQSVYLTIVSIGQMLALLTGGFDLSVGTILALASVAGAMAMAAVYGAMPDAVWLSITIGCLAGIAAGTSIGVMNGFGVAFFNVSPFMMSLGMASVGFGIALYLTGGVPVYGMPIEFGDTFGFGSLLGIPRRSWWLPFWCSCFTSSCTARLMAGISMRWAAISRQRRCRESTRAAYSSLRTCSARSSPPWRECC